MDEQTFPQTLIKGARSVVVDTPAKLVKAKFEGFKPMPVTESDAPADAPEPTLDREPAPAEPDTLAERPKPAKPSKP